MYPGLDRGAVEVLFPRLGSIKIICICRSWKLREVEYLYGGCKSIFVLCISYFTDISPHLGRCIGFKSNAEKEASTKVLHGI